MYVDESGSQNHTHFVLGSVAIFEGELKRHISNLDAIMERYFPGKGQDTEIHITELRSRAWKSQDANFTKSEFFNLLADLAAIVANMSERRGCVLFASVIHKPSLNPGDDPYVAAFEGLVNRFDNFLMNEHKAGHTHKGLLILDRSSERRTNQMREVFGEFRTDGTRWGSIYNLPEVPLFAKSSATRLLQLADFVAHAVFRRYESKDTREFDRILPSFYEVDGVIHGLGHLISKKEKCMCPPCVSRMSRHSEFT